jgi:hypothetical protein
MVECNIKSSSRLKFVTMIMIYLSKWAHHLKLAKYNDTKSWDRTRTYVQGRVQHQIIITLKICYHDHDISLKLVHPLNLSKYNDKKNCETILVLLFKSECNIKSSSPWKFITMIMIYLWNWRIHWILQSIIYKKFVKKLKHLACFD